MNLSQVLISISIIIQTCFIISLQTSETWAEKNELLKSEETTAASDEGGVAFDLEYHHEKENNEGSNVETIKGDQIEKEEEQEGDNGSEQQRQRPKELLIENGLLVLNHGE